MTKNNDTLLTVLLAILKRLLNQKEQKEGK